MAIDYKRELVAAAKSMILVHEPDVLIKMIARTIVHKVKVTHVGLLLHDQEKDTYVLTVSRGPTGIRIPAGFTRMDKDNPLIRLFLKKGATSYLTYGALVYRNASRFLEHSRSGKVPVLLKKALYQMEICAAQVAIPSYFRDELLGVLLLGGKSNKKIFVREELDFFGALSSDVAMALQNANLFRELHHELEKKKELFLNTTLALAGAIDAKDHYTHHHTARVREVSSAIARRLHRLNAKLFSLLFIEQLEIAAMLHDIGKIGIPESILNKIEPLTQEEWKKIQEHPSVGAGILQPIKELAHAVQGVRYHHEHYDGSGYPLGLKGEQIPVIAAAIAVADSFDAMTSDRPYRKSRTKEEAAEEIRSLSGTQFNPLIVDCFYTLYKEGAL